MLIETKSRIEWEEELLQNIIWYADYCTRCATDKEMPMTFEEWKKLTQ